MDANWALFAATLALVFVTAVMAWATWRYADVTERQLVETRRAESAKALQDMLRDYGTPEMQQAVSLLWALYRGCEGDKAVLWAHFAHGYQRQRAVLAGATRGSAPFPYEDLARSLPFLDLGPDQQRRLVSEFYRRLDTLVANGVISRQDADRNWTPDDRLILTEIIEPIEAELRKANWAS